METAGHETPSGVRELRLAVTAAHWEAAVAFYRDELCRNPRDTWELPGGWPSEQDTSLADVVRREVREESGLEVTVGPVVGADLLAIPGAGQVVVVALLAHPTHGTAPAASQEHSEVRFFARTLWCT